MFPALPDIYSDRLWVNDKILKNISNPDWHIGMQIWD